MDDQLRGRIQGFVEQLLKEEKSTLRKAQALLEIENQAIEIGDEIARQLAGGGSGGTVDRNRRAGAVLLPHLRTLLFGRAGSGTVDSPGKTG